MDKVNYDRYRILSFVHKASVITRAKLTSGSLARYQDMNMEIFKAIVDDLEGLGYMWHFYEHIPGRKGRAPKVYMVTAEGIAWIKQKDKETKKLLKKIN